MRALIIGAGVIGCSTALQLQRRGVQTTVIEAHGAVGHGSTSASCGIVRRFYSVPGMSALAHEAAQVWANWGEFLGHEEDLARFERPGALFSLPKIDGATRATVQHMKELGVDVSLLSRQQLQDRFPFVDTQRQDPTCAPDDPAFFEPRTSHIDGAIFEADAGYIQSPTLATTNLRTAGENAGVTFMLNSRVTSISPGSNSRFELGLQDGRSILGDILINIAGPHSSQVNAMAGVKLPLQTRALRREVHNVANPDGKNGAFPVIGDLDGGIYCRPGATPDELMVGSADPDCDHLDWVDDPDDYLEGVTDTYHQRQVLRLMKRLPAVGIGRPSGLSALYDVSVSDWYPIADKTELEGYYVCIGTSGSSFKTSPVLGQFMSHIIELCEDGHDIDKEPVPFRLSRLQRNLDTGFLSRLRGQLGDTSTVMG